MSEDQVIRLLAAVLAEREDDRTVPELLCGRALTHLRMDGVVATLLSTPDHRHVVYASDDEVVDIEDVQFTVGDGPVIEAYRDSRAVMVPDLPNEAPSRWPLFGEAAARRSTYAGVFAFPLLLGGAGAIGVLGLYRRPAGPLEHEAVAEAQVIAGAVAIAAVKGPPPPVDLDGLDLDTEAGLTRWSGSEQVVHQAVGMAVAQLRLRPFEALARLRAHAFTYDLTLDEVAMAVVERRLRLED